MPKIAVDAMGGDHAPAVVVEGALLAAQDVDAELILVGDKLAVEQECLRIGGKLPRFSILNATRSLACARVIGFYET